MVSLESVGFDVISAFTGGDGVSLARARQPDAIVLDLRLPDITGWEVCGLLKTDPQTGRIPDSRRPTHRRCATRRAVPVAPRTC